VVQTGKSDALDKMTVREVTGVFASRTAATPAVDDLLITGFDRADIDVLAHGQREQRVSQGAKTNRPNLAIRGCESAKTG
jgi:hypothetical protein